MYGRRELAEGLGYGVEGIGLRFSTHHVPFQSCFWISQVWW